MEIISLKIPLHSYHIIKFECPFSLLTKMFLCLSLLAKFVKRNDCLFLAPSLLSCFPTCFFKEQMRMLVLQFVIIYYILEIDIMDDD